MNLDQYFTSPDLASRIVKWAQLRRGDRVLEPSAGNGSIVRALPKNVHVTAIELDGSLVEELRGYHRPTLEVRHANFLDTKEREGWDVCIMNPPYGTKDSDVPPGSDGIHVAKAVGLAKRTIALVRTNFLHSSRRYHLVWRWAELTRMVVLVDRPKFSGPSDKGHTARHDFLVLEMVRLDKERDVSEPDKCEVEFWT